MQRTFLILGIFSLVLPIGGIMAACSTLFLLVVGVAYFITSPVGTSSLVYSEIKMWVQNLGPMIEFHPEPLKVQTVNTEEITQLTTKEYLRILSLTNEQWLHFIEVKRNDRQYLELIMREIVRRQVEYSTNNLVDNHPSGTKTPFDEIELCLEVLLGKLINPTAFAEVTALAVFAKAYELSNHIHQQYLQHYPLPSITAQN